MKKLTLFCFFLACTVSLSFGQIYRGDAETKNGTIDFSFNFVEHTEYRYLLYIDGVSIFMDEDNIAGFKAILEKFIEWEEIAGTERINLTKTIDSITFSLFYFSRTFFKEPLKFYFVFTGGPDDTKPARYTLFIDTTLDKIVPFRLSSKTVRELQLALSPEKLKEALESYEQQRALEDMFR